MKTKIFTLAALLMGTVSVSFAQTDLNLNLIHKYNGSDFQYNTVYTLDDGTAVNFSRVQYYLSGFELTHDGGQSLPLTDVYVLASSYITNYPLGQVNATTLEGISFDLGVDSLRNHMGTSNWTAPHPLASQSPTMDWNWPDGYFFWTITGKVDDTGDGIPNKAFEMHGIGDHLRRDVNGFSGLAISGASLDVDIYVNVADWIKSHNLPSVGFSHDGGSNNVLVADNTNDETVFTLEAPLGLNEVETDENKVYADYTIAYAPTIYYSLNTVNQVDIKVYDMNGQVVISEEDQSFEGSYFVRKELRSGSYLIVFSNGDLEESYRFIVQQ
jgi:hypothetical protein